MRVETEPGLTLPLDPPLLPREPAPHGPVTRRARSAVRDHRARASTRSGAVHLAALRPRLSARLPAKLPARPDDLAPLRGLLRRRPHARRGGAPLPADAGAVLAPPRPHLAT